MGARILRGDVRAFCRLHKALGLPLFHAAIMDAPYELGGQVSIDDALNVSKVGKGGFMSKSWDDTGVAFDPETWRAIADTLLPGAYIFCFAGNLNDDLISVAMRRAGLVKQHKALAWSQGSSLPKTTRISIQVDKAVGAKGTYGDYKSPDHAIRRKPGNQRMHEGYQRPWRDDPEAEDRYARVYEPATPLAQTWAGHRYGAQALRNLVESILIFRKPYEGKAYVSIVRTGAGSLNIEGSRIGVEERPVFEYRHKGENKVYGERKDGSNRTGEATTEGRHPSNFYLTHHEKCIPRGTKRVRGSNTVGSVSGKEGKDTKYYADAKSKHPFNVGKFTEYVDADGTEEVAAWECARDADGNYTCPVALLDEQAGVSKSSGNRRGEISETSTARSWANQSIKGIAHIDYNDMGGPSRFIQNADWQYEAFEQTARRIEDANAVTYRSKPSRREKDAGLDGFEEKVKDATYGDGFNSETKVVTDEQIRNGVDRGTMRNFHPTVKPIALMKYLAGLLLPPDAYAPRRLFVPFAGVASEMLGGILAGWEEVVGVEIDNDPEHYREYIPIARARIAWWQRQAHFGQTDPAVILANAPPEANDNGDVQLDLFAPEEPR